MAVEPAKQVEIQLGHMCNNRCVFCVSGQRTAMREAKPLAAEPILERITEAYESGHRKLTLLGGEPTLQPAFMQVVEHAVQLGFEEIVLFTNGVKTAHPEVVDAILATGGNFTWRISIQGATREAHENTTKKPGSFRRILRTMENLKARRQRITVNMCVVASNLASVPHFAELLLPFGVTQLHLDMMRPLDAGIRSKEDFAAMMPRLASYEAPMKTMADAFDARAPKFDLNVGNLPYCVAPSLLHRIHHDGEHTETIAVDHNDKLSQPWNKYFVKRRDKVKAEQCQQCVMHDACSGVFETYAELHGLDELVPIDLNRLRRLDPERRLLARHLRPVTAALRARSGEGMRIRTRERGEREVLVEASTDAARVVVALRPEGAARYRDFGATLVSRSGETPDVTRLLEAVAATLPNPIVPLGVDALGCLPSVQRRLRKLANAAPFGDLTWHGTSAHGVGVALHLREGAAEGAAAAKLWLDDSNGRPRGGYEVVGEATPALREGLKSALVALGAAK